MVHGEMVALVRSALRKIPGGYLVRQQDGDLKYLIAFSNSEAALYFCATLQLLALYATWPPSALKHWSEEWDPDTGELLFRWAMALAWPLHGSCMALAWHLHGSCMALAWPFLDPYPHATWLILRGPRLKMGMCEGQANSVIPDHLGKADYHGPSINQAARFMDAGKGSDLRLLEVAR